MADVSYFGTMMVFKGDADGMVSGAVHTTQHTIRPALQFIKTKPGISAVSSVFFMCLDDRVCVFGDCAVNPNPTAEQLAEIAILSADTGNNFGIEPRIALLSYSSGDSGSGEEVEKVRRATGLAKQMRPEMKIEGPIQYDAAVDPAIGKQKMPDSPVAGRASVLIFPDLNTGNNTYKAVQRETGALAIGPILQGMNKPVNDLSRGCTVSDIFNTIHAPFKVRKFRNLLWFSMNIFVLNSGSSSIKYQLFKMPSTKPVCSGLVERIGFENSFISHKVYSDGEKIKLRSLKK